MGDGCCILGQCRIGMGLFMLACFVGEFSKGNEDIDMSANYLR
jgi:hypothetical protein